jgi:hypothetical protein
VMWTSLTGCPGIAAQPVGWTSASCAPDGATVMVMVTTSQAPWSVWDYPQALAAVRAPRAPAVASTAWAHWIELSPCTWCLLQPWNRALPPRPVPLSHGIGVVDPSFTITCCTFCFHRVLSLCQVPTKAGGSARWSRCSEHLAVDRVRRSRGLQFGRGTAHLRRTACGCAEVCPALACVLPYAQRRGTTRASSAHPPTVANCCLLLLWQVTEFSVEEAGDREGEEGEDGIAAQLVEAVARNAHRSAVVRASCS